MRFDRLKRIVSGGQTGVDRAALDVAIANGIPHGGWCPRGRLAEDGRIDRRYHLSEMLSDNYADRTRQNVIDSDGTLILYVDQLVRGTLLTSKIARELGKPMILVRLDRRLAFKRVLEWIQSNDVQVLNVAGPRESAYPDIYQRAADFLNSLLDRLTAQSRLFPTEHGGLS